MIILPFRTILMMAITLAVAGMYAFTLARGVLAWYHQRKDK